MLDSTRKKSHFIDFYHLTEESSRKIKFDIRLYVPMNDSKTLEVLPDSQKMTSSSKEAVRYVVMHGTRAVKSVINSLRNTDNVD